MLDAGPFGEWLRSTLDSLRSGAGSQVACGDCVACCSSSYFVHVGPDEAQARKAIPAKLLFPAPGLPKGNSLMGFKRDGKCPMLSGRGCKVYDARPRTCRLYDCRIFPAAGILDVGEGKEAITRQAGRWKFLFPSPEDLRSHEAVRSAARFLAGHASSFPEGFVPSNPTQLAILAIRVHGVFLERTETDDDGALVTEIVAAA